MTTKMSDRCLTVIAGILGDHAFNHLCYIAECLSTILPNFQYKNISINSTEWKLWLKDTCLCHGWSHDKSPLIWREIGLTESHVHYIGGSYQFWRLLQEYYNITSHLSVEDLEALREDLLFAHEIKLQKEKELDVPEEYLRIMIIGAGRSMCPDIVPQLLLTKELWLSHGLIITLYDQPGCFFKIRKILRDAGTIGAGLNVINIVNNISEGLKNCDVLLYLDSLPREENEQTESWLHRNYKPIESLCEKVNEHAPTHMKVIFCSMSLPCFYAHVMVELVTKIPKTNIVVTSSNYGLELIYHFVTANGFTLEDFGAPPVWGYLGINHYIDVHYMVQKSRVYYPNKRALSANENAVLPLGIQSSELRWFFYISHDKDPYKNHFVRKALTRYQVGRSEDLPKSRAICDVLKLWYSKDKDVGDEIISLGVVSDGSFGIPKGLIFSQPVYLKELENGRRVWVPFKDFPMPSISLTLFQNFIDTALYIQEKIIRQRKKEVT